MTKLIDQNKKNVSDYLMTMLLANGWLAIVALAKGCTSTISMATIVTNSNVWPVPYSL